MMIISAVGFQTSEYVVTPFSVVAFTPHLPLLPSYFSTAASAAETDGLPSRRAGDGRVRKGQNLLIQYL